MYVYYLFSNKAVNMGNKTNNDGLFHDCQDITAQQELGHRAAALV